MAMIKDAKQSEKIGETSMMMYSKETSQGNTVFTGSFTDDKTGRTYYLRSSLVTAESQKRPGKECVIINVSVYKASRSK